MIVEVINCSWKSRSMIQDHYDGDMIIGTIFFSLANHALRSAIHNMGAFAQSEYSQNNSFIPSTESQFLAVT